MVMMMAAGVGRPWFVGCACDRNFVEPTAVMLTSLDLNGAVGEATVLVASFGLTEADREVLRAGAGRLAPRMRFVDVTDRMLEAFEHLRFEPLYPLPVLGRLFLPGAVDQPDARLLTIDSDMIVNHSLRPLFEMNMHDQFLGAIHDAWRIDDPNYFNSGLMLIEVEGFRSHDIARRTLEWLAARTSPPTWPDQDALNQIVGDSWVRLERSWNWFYCGPAIGDAVPLANEHYAAAHIAHFAGSKPWNIYDHAGRPLYQRYADQLVERKRLRVAARKNVDASFVITALEVLLGQQPATETVVTRWLGFPAQEVIAFLARSPHFALEVVLPLKMDLPFAPGLFRGIPDLRHRMWAVDRLPLTTESRERLARAADWRSLMQIIIDDHEFGRTTGLLPLLAVADGILSRVAARPGAQEASDSSPMLLAAE
jgi:lipopolysaccharide biosynthesis glycosyltransferase